MSYGDSWSSNGDSRGGGNDSYRDNRGRRDDYDRGGRQYQPNNGSGDRRYENSGYRDDRRGGDRSYDRGYGREDGDSWSRGREVDRGDRGRDFARDSGRYSFGSDSRGSRGYSPQRDINRSGSNAGYPPQGAYYDRENRNDRYQGPDRGRSPNQSYDRGYDRGYERNSSPRGYEGASMRQSRPGVREEEFGASAFQASGPSIRTSDSSMQVETSGIPGDIYLSASSQRHEMLPNLRASEPVYAQPNDLHSASYRMTSSSFQANPHHQGGRHELAESTSTFSISRAQTIPLDSFSSNGVSSSSSKAIISGATPSERVNSILVSKLRALTSNLSILDPSDQASFKEAIDACVASIQACHSSETESEKHGAGEMPNFKAIEESQSDLDSSLREYYLRDYQSRIVDGDFFETKRVLSNLEIPDGEWPEPHWTFPPRRSLHDLPPDETLPLHHESSDNNAMTV